jgi:hypothetical protein
MNTLADCGVAGHGDEVSSASITLRAEVRDGSGVLPVQRSAGREDDCGRGQAIIDALAEYSATGQTPAGGNWVRARMSRGDGVFEGGR